MQEWQPGRGRQRKALSGLINEYQMHAVSRNAYQDGESGTKPRLIAAKVNGTSLIPVA